MSKNIDIKIKQISNDKQHKLYPSQLVLEFSGNDVNNILMNTYRRVCLDEIPTYAFCQDLIKIEANTTIFNNDYMRLRLAQLPILNTECDIIDLEPKFWQTIDYSDPKRERHEKEKNIELYINVYNNTPNLKNVTTNDISYYEDGEPVEKYNKEFPVLLVQLRPNETFKAQLKGALGIGVRNNIFSSVSTAFYDVDEKDENKITLSLESQGQNTEYKIMIKASEYLLMKLNKLEKDFINRGKSDEYKNMKDQDTIKVDLENDDHTLGEFLNRAFQDHPKILFCGVSKQDHLVRTIRLTVSTEDRGNHFKYMLEKIEYLKDLVNLVNKQIKELSKK